jgi:hypothetical protein
MRMIEGTNATDSPAPLVEPGDVSSTPNHQTHEPPSKPSTVGKYFVAPGAVLRAAAERRVAAEYLRRSSP